MSYPRFDERFFTSTRGRIVLLLRRCSRTVNDLAEALELTDNAVRAHLLSLERDRVVEQAGTVRGRRKPHQVYKLTADARHLFPKPYDALFNRLLEVIKSKLPATGLSVVLREVGLRIAGDRGENVDAPLEARVDEAVAVLETLGGAAVAERTDKGLMITSQACPFADAVVEHPETCKIAESVIAEVVKLPVREACDRSGAPRCVFAIEDPAAQS